MCVSSHLCVLCALFDSDADMRLAVDPDADMVIDRLVSRFCSLFPLTLPPASSAEEEDECAIERAEQLCDAVAAKSWGCLDRRIFPDRIVHKLFPAPASPCDVEASIFCQRESSSASSTILRAASAE